jgi:hypothetical protein
MKEQSASILARNQPVDSARNERNLFGALIRKRFDVSSNQYADIDLLNMSIPILADDEQPNLLHSLGIDMFERSISGLRDLVVSAPEGSAVTDGRRSYCPKDESSREQTASVHASVASKLEPANHKISEEEIYRFRFQKSPFSFIPKDHFHQIYYGSVEASSEEEVIRCCLQALLGHESDLFQLRLKLHVQIVCPGYSYTSIRGLLSIYRKVLITRRLIEVCIASFNHMVDPIYSALRELIMDIIFIIDSHLKHTADSFASKRLKGFDSLFTATRLFRRILQHIVDIAFPSALQEALDEEQDNHSAKLHLTISQYLYSESWDVYHHHREGYEILAEAIDFSFKLASLVDKEISYDLFPSINVVADRLMAAPPQFKAHLADNFLSQLIGYIFLKKLSSRFIENLSSCLYQFVVDSSAEAIYDDLRPDESLLIATSSLFADPSQSSENFSGRSLLITLISAYRWSRCRLQMLSKSALYELRQHFEDGQILSPSLSFPIHSRDMTEISILIDVCRQRLTSAEKSTRELLMRWFDKESGSGTAPSTAVDVDESIASSLNKDRSNPIAIDNTAAVEANNPVNTSEPQDQDQDMITSSGIPVGVQGDGQRDTDGSKSNAVEGVLPFAYLNIDSSLFALAKSSIISKYSDLMRQVDDRRRVLQWHKYRADNLSSSRSQLRALYDDEKEAWKSSLGKLSFNDPSHEISVIPIAVKPPPSADMAKSVHSGIRLLGQAPGGNSSFQFTYDVSEDQSSGVHTGIRVTQSPGGSREATASKDMKPNDGVTESAEEPVSTASREADALTATAIDPHYVYPEQIELLDMEHKDDEASDIGKPKLDIITDLKETLIDDLHGNLVSMRSMHSGIRVNQAPGGDSSFKLWYETMVDKVDGNHDDDDDDEAIDHAIGLPADITDDEQSEASSIEQKPADTVRRVVVDRAYAQQIAMRLYEENIRSNTWLDLYELLYPSISYFDEDELIHQHCADLAHALTTLAKNHSVYSSRSDDREDPNTYLGKCLPKIFQSHLLQAVMIQVKLVDLASTRFAIDECKVLDSLDMIEDIFLISERSDRLLFVVDRAIDTYVSESKLYLEKSSISSSVTGQALQASQLSIWSIDLLNKSLMKESSSSSSSTGQSFNVSFIQSLTRIGEFVDATISSSSSWQLALFSADRLCLVGITYQLLSSAAFSDHSSRSMQIMHQTIYSREVLDVFAHTTRRLLELAQCRSLLRMIFTSLRQDRRIRSKDRKLYHIFEHVRSNIQAICDFTGDRLRVLRLQMKEQMLAEVEGNGIASIIHGVKNYAEILASFTFSCLTNDLKVVDTISYDGSIEKLLRDQDSEDLGIHTPIYKLIRLLLSCCRATLRYLYEILSSDDGDSASHDMQNLERCDKLMRKLRSDLVSRSIEYHHTQPSFKPHTDALLMYLGSDWK